MVHAKNDAARSFYERFDFQPSPTDPLHLFALVNTLEPYRDHTEHAIWLGEKLTIKGDVLDARIEPLQQDPVTPNSRAAARSVDVR